MTEPGAIPIDPELAAFLESGVSISLATRDPENLPSLTRSMGARVDGGAVTLFFSGRRAARVLANIEDNGMLAAVFSLPSSHVTVQLKARDARIVPLAPGDSARAAAYCADFLRVLAGIGHDDGALRFLVEHDPAELVAVRFTPCEAYTQTPGPKAGKPLEHE